MRQPGKNNRQRGRGRRNGHSGGQINRNTTIDSNGPEVRLRGNAQQLHEKYIALANDASAAGERIQAEAYFQFADHYFRVNSAIVAAAEERRDRHQENNTRSQSGDQSTEQDAKPVEDAADASENSSDADAASAASGESSGDATDMADGDDQPVNVAV